LYSYAVYALADAVPKTIHESNYGGNNTYIFAKHTMYNCTFVF